MPELKTIAEHISPKTGDRVHPPAIVNYGQQDSERLKAAGCLRELTDEDEREDNAGGGDDDTSTDPNAGDGSEDDNTENTGDQDSGDPSAEDNAGGDEAKKSTGKGSRKGTSNKKA